MTTTSNHAPITWTADDLPDQTGRTVVVTGASSGLGLVLTRALVGRGAQVVMAVRDAAKGESVRAELLADRPSGRLDVVTLDLLDLDSVRRFADHLHDQDRAVDVLVNNAGIGNVPRHLSPQGYESHFATNHLGHFALTGLLLDLLDRGTEPRVVSVGSNLYRRVRVTIDFDDLAGDRGYSPGRAYIRSKLANILFGTELDRRLRDADSGVRSLVAHPGMASTPMHQHVRSVGQRALMRVMSALLSRTAEQGAAPILYATAAPGAPTGLFIGPSARKSDLRVHFDALRPPADDLDLAARLWQVSEDITGVRFLSGADAPRQP